jgi:hypothetical protein
MTDEPNRDREQPVEAQRDGALDTEPVGGALLPIGGPGNDPDADKLGDDDAEVEPRAPAEEDARESSGQRRRGAPPWTSESE